MLVVPFIVLNRIIPLNRRGSDVFLRIPLPYWKEAQMNQGLTPPSLIRQVIPPCMPLSVLHTTSSRYYLICPYNIPVEALICSNGKFWVHGGSCCFEGFIQVSTFPWGPPRHFKIILRATDSVPRNVVCVVILSCCDLEIHNTYYADKGRRHLQLNTFGSIERV